LLGNGHKMIDFYVEKNLADWLFQISN